MKRKSKDEIKPESKADTKRESKVDVKKESKPEIKLESIVEIKREFKLDTQQSDPKLGTKKFQGKRESKRESRFKSTYHRFKLVVPVVVVTMCIAACNTFGIALWGFITLYTDEGMQWSSPMIAFMGSVVAISSFLMSNAIFVKW